MRVFDLHCDTLTSPVGHVSLEHSRLFKQWVQVFAVFVPDRLQGQAAVEYCDQVIDSYYAQLDEMVKHCTPILAIENGNALAGDLSRLEMLAQKQVKAITLTWNGENELGYGAACDPALGLKPFGKQAVQRMCELNILPDVSHLNEAGFWEVARFGRPLLATHSNCAAITPHVRNLNDDQLKAMFASGGLVGLCLCQEFLGEAGDAKAVARHLEHVLALGGEHHVALGSDFDGCSIHPSLAGAERLPGLNESLAQMGFDDNIREKFFWSNAANFFEKQVRQHETPPSNS